ncbi:hypothetical protein M5K25_021207 [Dendrobium thyrsiflorum]|uniref:Uncharacterized protein n=1 Tax=Dendrobium thyrsiflorum TaxID=117978 RepID=A0ABD0UCH9_DENTH
MYPEVHSGGDFFQGVLGSMPGHGHRIVDKELSIQLRSYIIWYQSRQDGSVRQQLLDVCRRRHPLSHLAKIEFRQFLLFFPGTSSATFCRYGSANLKSYHTFSGSAISSLSSNIFLRAFCFLGCLDYFPRLGKMIISGSYTMLWYAVSITLDCCESVESDFTSLRAGALNFPGLDDDDTCPPFPWTVHGQPGKDVILTLDDPSRTLSLSPGLKLPHLCAVCQFLGTLPVLFLRFFCSSSALPSYYSDWILNIVCWNMRLHPALHLWASSAVVAAD